MTTASTMMDDSQLLLSQLMDRGAKMQPDNKIVTMCEEGYQETTYAEHQQDVYRIATALQKLGVKHGECVGTFMWNNSRHFACYHAVPCMGAVLHTINIRLSTEQLNYIIKHAGDRVIFVDADMLPALEKCSEDTLAQVDLFIISGTDYKRDGWTTTLPANKVVEWEDFLGSEMFSNFEWPNFPETSAAALCYTSGTTGVPKGVAYSHRSTYLHTQICCHADTLALSGIDALLDIVPMFHVNSWGLPYAACMLGMKILLPNRFNSGDRLLQFMVDHEATVSCGVPTIWQGMRAVMAQDIEGYRPKIKLNRLCCGGSAPPPELMLWYNQNFGISFVQAWGMTETNPLGTVARQVAKYKHTKQTPEQQFENVIPAGLPIAGLELSIREQEDLHKVMPFDGEATGELLIRGPWITASYHKNEEASSAPDKFHVDATGKNWLVTGDMASIDVEGNLIIRDRSKDLIKSGGEWISSVDLENHITSLDSVSMACVVAQPHPRWDERPVAIVIPTAGLEQDQTALRTAVLEHVAAKFAKFEVPDDVLCWGEIPMTSTGKLDKKTVRAQLADEGYVLPSLRDAKSRL